jgi:hypothetical protein
MYIKNKKEFFENVKLDENGNVMVIIVDDSGNTLTNTKSQYDFFKNVELTEEGYLKITIK